ncbi:MAG: hypothetical protein IJ111_11270, partial [Eggerthellaceae bacterium]|nr:hypothetical protein [Eggerthellaceae bacterium]
NPVRVDDPLGVIGSNVVVEPPFVQPAPLADFSNGFLDIGRKVVRQGGRADWFKSLSGFSKTPSTCG